MKIRSIYNRGEPVKGLSFLTVQSAAKQSFVAESDINNLVAKYMKTGVFYENPGTRSLQFGDFSEVGSYREIVERVQSVEAHFAELPADVRAQFNNDVALYLEAAEADLAAAEAASDDEEDSEEDSEPEGDSGDDPEPLDQSST